VKVKRLLSGQSPAGNLASEQYFSSYCSVDDMAKQPQPAGKPEEIAKRLSKALERDTAAFTSALLAIIKKRGMTTMAKEIGVSRHTLYRYEWGDDRP